jgi:acyl-CoA synthetase (AMP-forming)/AMP-acid ligase II
MVSEHPSIISSVPWTRFRTEQFSSKDIIISGGENVSTPNDIIGVCRTHLAHFKAPRTVIFGSLPKTSTGTIRKFMLRERVKQG